MSFGFSVSDFALVCKLIVDIRSTLDNARGSKGEYQGLIHELGYLDDALRRLQRLEDSDISQGTLDSIKASAFACHHPLRDFLDKIKRYDKALGTSSSEHIFTTSVAKLRWRISKQDEARKLQSYLNVHVGTLNMLLNEHNLALLEDLGLKSKRDSWHIRERLDTTCKILTKIHNGVVEQATAMKAIKSMIDQVLRLMNAHVRTSWKAFQETVAGVCVATQQIHAIVLEIRQILLTSPDTRWTFFQDPLCVEDPYGHKFPVPSEYDYTLLQGIIRLRLQDSSCSEHITNEHYFLYYANSGRHLPAPNVALLPGELVMVMVLQYSVVDRHYYRPNNAPILDDKVAQEEKYKTPSTEDGYDVLNNISPLSKPIGTQTSKEASLRDLGLKNVLSIPVKILPSYLCISTSPSADEILNVTRALQDEYDARNACIMTNILNELLRITQLNGAHLWETFYDLRRCTEMKLSSACTAAEELEAARFYSVGLLRAFAGHRTILLQIGRFSPEACAKLGDDWALKRVELWNALTA